MGCGASSEGGGEPGEFKPKKGARCMAPCAWDGDEPHVAIISKVEEPAQGTGDSTTYEVYFPEYEPKLGELPTGTSPEAAKEFAEKQKQAIAAKLPWTKKVSLKGGFTQDQLTHCPFPRRLGKKQMHETKIPKVDEICGPAGEILTTLSKTNDAVYTVWEEAFKLEKKYNLDFAVLVRAVKDKLGPAAELATSLPKLISGDGSEEGTLAKEVTIAVAKMGKACFDAAAAIPPLVESIKAIGESVQEATKPEDGQSAQDKLKAMCEEAGLPPLDQLKAVKGATQNVLLLKDLPKIMTGLVDTAKFTIKSVQSAIGDSAKADA